MEPLIKKQVPVVLAKQAALAECVKEARENPRPTGPQVPRSPFCPKGKSLLTKLRGK